MKAIACVDQRWGIGKDGDQLCYLSADLKRFKALTLGHPVILGRKTLTTFPGGRPLPGRPNLILSRDPNFQVEGAQVFGDLPSLLAAASDDSVVIGGGSIYRLLLDFCDLVYITKVFHTFDADVFFPDLDADPRWQVVETQPPLEEKGLQFQYVTYQRRGGQ